MYTRIEKDVGTDLKMDQKVVTVTKEQVVDEVYKLRKGISKAEQLVVIEASDKKMDNVTTEEVVDIINQQRKDDQLKPPYENMLIPDESLLLPYAHWLTKYVHPKFKELEEIFEEAGERMEWERIVADRAQSVQKSVESITSPAAGNRSDMIRCGIQRQIVERLDNHEVVQKYNALNKDFGIRVKQENWETDEKNINEKRAQKSPKEKDYQKKRGVDTNEN